MNKHRKQNQKKSGLRQRNLSSAGLSILACKNFLAVLIQLQFRNFNLAGVERNRDGCTICLLALETLNVNAPLTTVDLCDLSLLTLEVASGNSDLKKSTRIMILCFMLSSHILKNTSQMSNIYV